jgi:hypothetical protein
VCIDTPVPHLYHNHHHHHCNYNYCSVYILSWRINSIKNSGCVWCFLL